MNANENNNRDDAEAPHEIPPAVPSTSDEEEGNDQKKNSHEDTAKCDSNKHNGKEDDNAYSREVNNSSGILYSQTIMGNPNNNQMMYPNNGSQQFQQPGFDQGSNPSYSYPQPPNNNNNMPFNQYPLNNQLPPQYNNMNNILPPNLNLGQPEPIMQLPPIPSPPNPPKNVGGLDAQRQYYEEQMRQHALQYANAAAGAAWAAARIACGGGNNNVNASVSSDIVLQNPGGGFVPSQVQQQQASYYTPVASGPGLIDNSIQQQEQQYPGQKRTLWQPSSPGNNNTRRSSGLKIEAKPKASQQDKKRSKKRESGNSSLSSLGSDSRDLKGFGSSNKKLSGKKSSQRRRFNEDANTEGVNTSNKRALHHGHGSKSSFSSLGSNGNNSQRGRNKKKNRSQSNSSTPQKSTGSRGSILPPPPSIFLGGLLGKNGVRALHELCGKYHWDMPKYTLVDPQSGAQLSDNDGSVKSHKDTFCMTVHVNSVELGRGRGGMKNAAKQDGSRKALAALIPGVIFDPNGILTDIGGTRRKSLSLDELGPHLASQLAIGGANGPLGAGVGGEGDHSETSSISTAIDISEDVIGHGALVSGGPLLSSKLGALSSPGGSLNASGSGRIFSSNIYPSSGVSSASDVDDEDENAYYASRGASVCSTLLHAMWQIDNDRIREPPSYSFDLCPSINNDAVSSGDAASSSSKRKNAEESPREAPSRPRMFQCIATINLYFPKHQVGDNDDIMTYWQSPLDYLQAKYSSSSPTSDKVESSQSRKRKDSFSFESPSPNKAARPNHSTDNEQKVETTSKIESNQEPEKKEEVVLHKLTGTGLGSTKRESKHKASAQLLSSLFPGCSSIVEVKAEAEASRELYAANRVATSQTKRAKLSSPESKKNSKRSAFSGTPSTTKSGISLLGLSLSEPKRAKRTQWTAEEKQQTFQDEVDAALLSLQELDDEGETNNDDDKVGRIILRRATEDDADHIHALMEKYKASPSKKECSTTQKESLNSGDEDHESDHVDEINAFQELQLSDETFIFVLSRAAATQDPPLGCAILTTDTSSEGRALALRRIDHEKHLPRESFDECLETFAKSIHCRIENSSNNLADQSEMTLEKIRSCISRSSQQPYQAEDVKRYHQLHSVKEEENEESESDGDKKESDTIVKEASKPSKRSRVV